MNHALDDLTEKEKEALRLLLSGHDAKSSARELDISVHTVNDRLRNARRKIGVSSSREAARILGEAEGSAPQTPAHKTIGIAENVASGDPADLNETAGSGPSGTVWLAGGMLTMSLIIAIAAVAMVNGDTTAETAFASESAAAETHAAADAQLTMAEQAATAWLALIDNGFAEESRVEAATALRNRYSEQIWELGVALRLNNHGVPMERRLLTMESSSTNSNGVSGDYQTLVYETDFADSRNVFEEIVLMREDGEWRVADYDMVTEEERNAQS